MTEPNKFETPFQRSNVEQDWRPERFRCLIVGESPGTKGSPYFYDPVPSQGEDPIVVRRLLLRGLVENDLIETATLDAFRAGGFLFDHAIREQLPQSIVRREQKLAESFHSELPAEATHLLPLIQEAESVWAMGWIARNAVACLLPSIPRSRHSLTPPYRLSERVFASRYFTRYTNQGEVNHIIGLARRFIP